MDWSIASMYEASEILAGQGLGGHRSPRRQTLIASSDQPQHSVLTPFYTVIKPRISAIIMATPTQLPILNIILKHVLQLQHNASPFLQPCLI